MRHWPVSLLILGLLATPAAAQEDTWQEAVGAIADQLTRMPRTVKLRTLAIQDIKEEQTQVRWPLSDQLERALAESLTRQRAPFQVLNQGLTGELGQGDDAILTGTFTRDPATRRLRVSLMVRNLKNQETLYTLAPVGVAEAGLPAGAAPNVTFGRLVITTDVPGAQIFVDGALAGKGSLVKSLPLGSHVVTAAAEGHEVAERVAMLGTDGPAMISLNLKPQTVITRLEGEPAGATVKVDGVERGTLPLSLEDLAPGKHKISLGMPGYKPYEGEFEWEPSKAGPLRFRLDLLPGNLVIGADAPDALITLDGAVLGKTPRLLSGLAAGSHKLRLEAHGYAAYEQEVVVKSNQTTSLRAHLVPGNGRTEVRAEAIALVGRAGTRAERALLEELAGYLAAQHPGVPIVPVDLALATVDRLMPDGLMEDPASLKALAGALAARQIVVLHDLQFSPFARVLGAWPQRPHMQASLVTYRSSGQALGERRFGAEGGEPRGLGMDAPGAAQVQALLVPDLADAIAGEASPRPIADGKRLDHEAFLLGDFNRLHLGAGLDFRPFPYLQFGSSAWYFNALDADRTGGTQLPGTNGGAALVYGRGQAIQGRLDAVLRFDGSLPPLGPLYDGPRWTPYLGAGYRIDVERHEVYAVGRKDSEGGFWQPVQRGVALGGVKLYASGTVWKAEVEYPFLYNVWDTPDLRLNLGAGWVW